jgi:MFS family permease
MDVVTQEKSHINKFGLFIWTLAALFFLYEFFLRTFIGTIVDEITKSMHLTPEHLSIIGAAYYLTYGVMQIPVGMLIDRYGARLLLTIAAIVCVFGVFLFSTAQDFYLAILGRLLMGLGSSFSFVGLLIIALNWFPRQRFGFFAGLAQFLGAVGPMLAGAPLVMLLYVAHDDWRVVLTGIGILGLILAILIALFVRNRPPGYKYKTIFLHFREPWWKKLILLFKNSQAWMIVIYAFSNYIPIALLGAVWGTAYLQSRGMSQSNAAFVTSLLWLGLGIGSPLFGYISDRIKRRKSILTFCASLGITSTLLIIYWPGAYKPIFGLLFFALGLAGSGQSLSFAFMSEQVPTNLHATALGLNNTSLTLSSAFMIPLISLLIQFSIHGHIGTGIIYQQSDFTLSLLSLVVLYVLALLVAIFALKETYCRQQHEPFKLKINPFY